MLFYYYILFYIIFIIHIILLYPFKATLLTLSINSGVFPYNAQISIIQIFTLASILKHCQVQATLPKLAVIPGYSYAIIKTRNCVQVQREVAALCALHVAGPFHSTSLHYAAHRSMQFHFVPLSSNSIHKSSCQCAQVHPMAPAPLSAALLLRLLSCCCCCLYCYSCGCLSSLRTRQISAINCCRCCCCYCCLEALFASFMLISRAQLINGPMGMLYLR